MITLSDLPVSRALDLEAMSSLRGGGAPWVFGAFRPFVQAAPSATPVLNLFQVTNNITNNTTIIESMVNQFTILDIDNSGDNANVTAVLLGSQAN